MTLHPFMSASALAGVAAGTALNLYITDSASRTYNVSFTSWRNGNSSEYSSDYNGTRIVTSTDIASGLKATFNSSISSSLAAAGLYDPSVSIKSARSATELASDCVTAPAIKPTLTAVATGLELDVPEDLDGGDYAMCYLAQEDSPNWELRLLGQ